MDTKEVTTGGCLCAHIRYEFTGERVFQVLCHCRMCQKASGGPLMGLIFLDKQNLRITKGKPLNYQSTSTTQREFCGRCGSPVFFARQTRPELIGVFVGSLDDPNAFSPQYHLCTSSAVGWLHVDDELPRFEEKPAGMSATVGYDSATGHVTEPE